MRQTSFAAEGRVRQPGSSCPIVILLIARALYSIAPYSLRVSDSIDAHKLVADVAQLGVSTRDSRSVCVSDVGTRSCNSSPAMNSLVVLTGTMLDVPLHGMYVYMKH